MMADSPSRPTQPRPRALFIAHRLPFPPDKGERVRAFHEILALAEAFDLTVASLAPDRPDPSAVEKLSRYCSNLVVCRAGGPAGLVRGGLKLLTGRSVTEGYFDSRSMRKQLGRLAGEEPFDLAFGYCSSVLRHLLAVPARARVLDLVDVDSAKWAHYGEQAGFLKSRVFLAEARAVGRLEQEAIGRCDAVFLVSADEARVLKASPHAEGKLVPVSNGVDVDFFTAPEDLPPREGLVFTGTMDYRPNVEGVCWFVRDIWPELRKQHPHLTLTIVGRDPVAEIRRLGDREGIRVTGTVEDVRPYLHAAAVAVVPLRIARGIQNKVLEAMAAGCAVVGSPGALEGLELQPGRDVLRAGTVGQWRSCIDELLSAPSRREELARRGKDLVDRTYRWGPRLADMMEVCTRLAGRGPSQDADTRGKGARS